MKREVDARETDRFITLPLSLELVFGAVALLGAEMVAAMIVGEECKEEASRVFIGVGRSVECLLRPSAGLSLMQNEDQSRSAAEEYD